MYCIDCFRHLVLFSPCTTRCMHSLWIWWQPPKQSHGCGYHLHQHLLQLSLTAALNSRCCCRQVEHQLSLNKLTKLYLDHIGVDMGLLITLCCSTQLVCASQFGQGSSRSHASMSRSWNAVCNARPGCKQAQFMPLRKQAQISTKLPIPRMLVLLLERSHHPQNQPM